MSLVLAGRVPVPGTGTRPIEALEARWPDVPDFEGERFVEVPIDDELGDRLAEPVAELRALGML